MKQKPLGEKKIAVVYIYYCPIKGDFVNIKDDCPKCKDFNDGECPFYQEVELLRKPEIEKTLKGRVVWV